MTAGAGMWVLMTRQGFHIVQAFRAAHHVDLECLLLGLGRAPCAT